MMQGDSYNIAFEILNTYGQPITEEELSNIEISIGSLRKTTYDGVRYDSGNGTWLFPLSQEESFQLPRKVKGQVRLVWSNGDVEGIPLEEIRIDESISREVL